jgi:hypothetical protein
MLLHKYFLISCAPAPPHPSALETAHSAREKACSMMRCPLNKMHVGTSKIIWMGRGGVRARRGKRGPGEQVLPICSCKYLPKCTSWEEIIVFEY